MPFRGTWNADRAILAAAAIAQQEFFPCLKRRSRSEEPVVYVPVSTWTR